MTEEEPRKPIISGRALGKILNGRTSLPKLGANMTTPNHEQVKNDTMSLLNERPDLLSIIKDIIELSKHKRVTWNTMMHGFEYYDVYKGTPQIMKHLVERGLLRVGVVNGSRRTYQPWNETAMEEGVKDWERCNGEITFQSQGPSIPDDLFNCITGHDDIKEILWKSIRAERPVHCILVGPPACSKSIFLLELKRLPNSDYILGHSTSRAGLSDYLLGRRPDYLQIDELDKMDMKDFATLLSLMESGIVSETKYGKTRGDTLTTKVYAACNNITKIPNELQSRFMKLYFVPYNEKDFLDTTRGVLMLREGLDEKLAEFIARMTWDHLEHDIREAVRISRMTKTQDDVTKTIELIQKRSKKVVYN